MGDYDPAIDHRIIALQAAAQTASTYEPTSSVLTRADHFAHCIATGEITAGATDQPKP